MKWIVVVLITANILFAWRWWAAEQALEQASVQHAKMEAHALKLEKNVFELEQKLLAMEEKTVEGMTDKLNSHFLEGWGELLEEFKNKVEETRKQIEEDLQLDEGPKNNKDGRT